MTANGHNLISSGELVELGKVVTPETAAAYEAVVQPAVAGAVETPPEEYRGLLGGEQKYEDVNRFVENLLAGGQPKSLEEYVEIHQRRIGPRQRKVLAYLLASSSARLRDYAYKWMELAGQESGAEDFLLLQKYKTLEVPENARHLTFNPGAN